MNDVILSSRMEVISLSDAKPDSTKTGILTGMNPLYAPLGEVTGKISQCDIVNANGFLIPKNEWHDMLEANRDRLEKGLIVSTSGHNEAPICDDDVRHGIINAVIKDLWIEPDGAVYMKATIANTTTGRDLMGYLAAGGYIQASTRLGIVPRKEDGVDSLVGQDSIIYSVDFVLDPAIESTWLEFKAASKSKNSKVLSKDIKVSNKVDIDTYSMELSYNINKVKEALAYEQEKNRILKGNK